MSRTFASPKFAQQFKDAFSKLSETKLDLYELTDYHNLYGTKKQVLQEFFNKLGEKEVKDYTVGVGISGQIGIADTIRSYSTNMKGSVPLWGETYESLHKTYPVRPDHYFSCIDDKGKECLLQGKNYELQEFKTGQRISHFRPEGLSVYLPTVNGLKAMVKDAIMERVNDICFHLDTKI